MKDLIRLMNDEAGATSVEYALIAILVSIAAIGAMGALGTSLSSLFSHTTSLVDAAL